MEDQFCIKECAKWIVSNEFLKVGLEFTDGHEYATTVDHLLKREIDGYECSFIVLEDKAKKLGSCCVDECTAKPRGIDAIIHFGCTCLTPTRALPVLHVLSSCYTIEKEKIKESLLSEEKLKRDDNVILYYDILCTPFMSMLYSNLKTYFPNLVLSTLEVPKKSTVIYSGADILEDFESKLKIKNSDTKSFIKNSDTNSFIFGNRRFNLPFDKSIEDYNFIYIGPNSPALFSVQMRFSDKIFYNVNPLDNSLTVTNFVKTVMGRSRKIEQVKEAKTIGILGKLVASYEEIKTRMLKLIQAANKGYQFLILNNITEALVANTIGVDVYVYISCPQSSLFDRNDDTYLYKNVVTPWELEVALNPEYNWSLNFETDFTQLLKNDLDIEEAEPQSSEEVGDVQERDANASALLPRNPGTLHRIHENAAGEALKSLSWQGLNPKEESSVPLGKVVEGRRGIALQYENENY